MDINPYEVLGIDRNANDKAIKKAYHELIHKWHSDHFQFATEAEQQAAKVKTQEILEAWNLIGTQKARATYDASHPVSNSVYEHYEKKATSD